MSGALFRNDRGGLKPADRMDLLAVVRPHPHGGWTHARRVSLLGTVRIFSGWWPTQRAARRALP